MHEKVGCLKKCRVKCSVETSMDRKSQKCRLRRFLWDTLEGGGHVAILLYNLSTDWWQIFTTVLETKLVSEKYTRLSTSSSKLVQSYNLKRILSRCQIYPETRTKSAIKLDKLPHLKVLDDTARYAGLLLAPAEGFGHRPRLFLAFGQKKVFLCCFGQFVAIFGVK